jgi:catechol 2,3-dioxygenase-like lactoylglutathione lyase family enzyme
MTSNIKKPEANIEFTFDHVGISVSNLDRSIEFYTKIFGFKCERIIETPMGNGKVALLQKEGITIEMLGYSNVLPLPDDRKIPAEDIKTIGVKHFAIRVNDIMGAADFLKKNGVEFISEPTLGVRGWRRFFVKDPDGIPLELTEGPVHG